MSRPRCAYCGKLLRPWTDKVWAPHAPDSVYAMKDWRYSGNAQVVAHGYDTVLVKPNGRMTKWQEGMEVWASEAEREGVKERRLAWVATWDGQTYHGDGLFCGNPCARGFAQAAHRGGYRMRRAA